MGLFTDGSFVHVVLIPDFFKFVEGFFERQAFLASDGDDERIDDAERCDKRIDKGGHIASGKQLDIRKRGDGSDIAVGEGDNGCSHGIYV